MEDRVIPDIMNHVFYPKEDILKISILLSLSVSKNFAIGSVSGRGYLEDVDGVPDRRLGGQGHP